MITIRQIPKEEVAQIWPQIGEWVKSALGNDESYTSDDIKQTCETGALELRVIHVGNEIKGFLIYSIYSAPQCKCCYAPWLGGEDLALWVAAAFEEFRAFLKERNVRQYSFMGRKAWSKFLKVDSEQSCYSVLL